MAGRDLFETMGSLRSVREFTDEPVSEADLRLILDMTTKAPNGGNTQPWRFIVVRDPAKRRELGRIYLESMLQQVKAKSVDEAIARSTNSVTLRHALHLASTIGQRPPVLVLCCTYDTGVADKGSSIFPATQNLMLAAWGLGLGTVLTTIWQLRDREVRRLLGIPDELYMAALIPIGHPARKYGPPKRKPLEEVVYLDGWKQPFIIQ